MKGGLWGQALLLIALALLPAVGQAFYYGDRAPWQAQPVTSDEVDLAQAQAWGDSVMWLDARPDAQFQQEHIPGAILLNEDRWNELLGPMLAAWDPDKHVVVYCSSLSCGASHDVARRLRDEARLSNVYVLRGGWETWQAAKK